MVRSRAIKEIETGEMGKQYGKAEFLLNRRCVEAEGNQYFPPDAIKQEYLKPSEAHSVCPWKGTASYDDLDVNGKQNLGAAWYYPEPKPAAK